MQQKWVVPPVSCSKSWPQNHETKKVFIPPTFEVFVTQQQLIHEVIVQDSKNINVYKESEETFHHPLISLLIFIGNSWLYILPISFWCVHIHVFIRCPCFPSFPFNNGVPGSRWTGLSYSYQMHTMPQYGCTTTVLTISSTDGHLGCFPFLV